MARAKNGEAVSAERRTKGELAKLKALYWSAKSSGDLETWRRAKAVSGYLAHRSVIELSKELDVTRGSINRWLQWFNAAGADGLRPRDRLGATPRLTVKQRDDLAKMVEAGPQESGFTSGMWTGPMIGDLIQKKFGVRYHNHHVPRLLNQMGFSVQRPRKRLARADVDAQAIWLRYRLPAIKKKRPPAEGSSSSRMKPASGSMELFTKPGPE